MYATVRVIQAESVSVCLSLWLSRQRWMHRIG